MKLTLECALDIDGPGTEINEFLIVNFLLVGQRYPTWTEPSIYISSLQCCCEVKQIDLKLESQIV